MKTWMIALFPVAAALLLGVVPGRSASYPNCPETGNLGPCVIEVKAANSSGIYSISLYLPGTSADPTQGVTVTPGRAVEWRADTNMLGGTFYVFFRPDKGKLFLARDVFQIDSKSSDGDRIPRNALSVSSEYVIFWTDESGHTAALDPKVVTTNGGPLQ